MKKLTLNMDTISIHFTDFEWTTLMIYEDQKNKKNSDTIYMSAKQWSILPKLQEKYNKLVKRIEDK